MYHFNNITVTPNNEGVLISTPTRDVQVRIGRPNTVFIDGHIEDWENASDAYLLKRAKKRVCDNNFTLFNGVKETAKLALDGKFDELVKLIGGYNYPRSYEIDPNSKVVKIVGKYNPYESEDTRKSNAKVKLIERTLDETFNSIKIGYTNALKDLKKKRGYNRITVDFYIGDSKLPHQYSHGENSNVNYPRDIALSILDSLNYVDEYKFDVFSDYMNFLSEFGYSENCDNASKNRFKEGEQIIESMKRIRDEVSIDYTANHAAMLWLTNGFSDGDEELAQKGYIPLDEIEYSICTATIVWKDTSVEEEVTISFYEKGIHTSDYEKDENIFYYFEIGEDLYGNQGDFILTKLNWKN